MSGGKLWTILIVEDDETILLTLKLFLEGEGYAVQTATNGLEAIEYLKGHELPDLILLDMKMPIMSGWQFADVFHEQFDHLAPIIVMTAAADARKRANDVQANEWLDKPFELMELLKKIDAYKNRPGSSVGNPGSAEPPALTE